MSGRSEKKRSPLSSNFGSESEVEQSNARDGAGATLCPVETKA